MPHFWVNTFNPVFLHIFGLPLHWYGLAYGFMILTGGRLMKRAVSRYEIAASPHSLVMFSWYLTVGVEVGGRLGEAIFYNHTLLHAIRILAISGGGMSSHGGIIGVAVATLLFARKSRQSPFALADAVCLIAPLGLFLGRVANFVNSELVGAPTQVAWAVVFPAVDMVPRHPVQLYQALLEGPLLFAIVAFVASRTTRSGLAAVAFLTAYAVLRLFSETFRQVDPEHLGYHLGLTDGQWLSVGLLAAAGVLYVASACSKSYLTGAHALKSIF